jgi:putative flippase GtrA
MLVRYVLTGGVASAVYYAVFAAGWLVSVPYLAMAVIANLVTAVVTFPLYRRGVFRSSGPWVPAFLRFYAVCLWSLGSNLIGLPLLVEVAGLPVLLAQLLMIVVVPLVNYQVNKHWTFGVAARRG